jgi:hypothetical protein
MTGGAPFQVFNIFVNSYKMNKTMTMGHVYQSFIILEEFLENDLK